MEQAGSALSPRGLGEKAGKHGRRDLFRSVKAMQRARRGVAAVPCRRLYAIGGNREAARLSGLPVSRDLFITYTISGLLAGVAGLLAAAQLMQGSSLIGRGYELDAIAAVVVGGASLVGGKGDPLSAVIGVFVLACIVNIMNLVGISSEPQLVIKGAVIIAAVFLSSAGGVARISAGLGRLRGARHRTAAGESAPLASS